MQEFTINEEYTDMRLDRFVGKAFKELSKGAIQKMIRKGRVKLNGKKADANTRLEIDDVVSVYIKDESNPLPPKKDLPMPEIVYEDEFFLAVNKPAGLLTHPNGKKDDSLIERVISYLYDDIKGSNGMFMPGTINRLDMNTSGIVIVPKTPSAAKEMNALMKKNKFVKDYLVLVKGHFVERIKVTHYAIKDSEQNKMELFDTPRDDAVKMITVFDPMSYGDDCTLLSARLITGRTHQIRAQLGQMGYPIAGDKKYGDASFNRTIGKDGGLKRQFLHCYSVSFPMWTDHSTIRLICKPPNDIQNVLDKLQISFDFNT